MSNIVKLYETGPWGPLEEQMAEDMMEYDYNPHDKNHVDEYFKDLEGEANGPIYWDMQLFGKPVRVTLDLLYAENENETKET